MRSELKNILFSLIATIWSILFLVSCNKTAKKIEHVKIRPVVKIIVDSIAKYNVLTGSAVGYAGIKPVQWDRYEKLSKMASLPELRELTYHKNLVVRCYAYYALASKKDTSSFTILLNHLHDTARVSTFFGCIKSYEPTGDFFLNTVKPFETTDNGYKLSLKQKAIVDSVLLFDKHIKLYARYWLFHDLKPQSQYYNRVKEIAIEGAMPVAIWTLAKYKNHNDINI